MNLDNKVIINKGLFNNIDVMENTFESFKEALNKAYILRFSINLLKDNNIIIFDEKSLERLFNVRDNINKFDYEDLNYISTYNILKLLDIKDLIKDKLVIITLKEYNKKSLQYILRELNKLESTIIIESDSIKTLRFFKKKNYQVSLIINKHNKKKLNSFFKPDIYNIEINLFDKKRIKLLKEDYYVIGSIIKNNNELLENKDIYNNLILENT